MLRPVRTHRPQFTSPMRETALCWLRHLVWSLICWPQVAFTVEVLEPAKSLPVTHEVDVVVVGGSSGGVAAAVEAARHGATVFLAAPRPYLGEDICATYRLWLEPGEEPLTALAKEVFAPPAPVETIRPGLAFTYTADRASSPKHKDTTPPSLLADGKWHSAPSQSVQYDGEATLTVDLGQEQALRRLSVLVYQRPADFEVARVAVSVSSDSRTWEPLTVLENDRLDQGGFEATALGLTASVATRGRYLKLHVKKGSQANRVLLGEIVVAGEDDIAPPPVAEAPRAVTPMQVKRALDQALIQAQVPFLYSSLVTELLEDRHERTAGVVLANRSGRQAVIAKVIVDATERATVARLAGARFKVAAEKERVFERIVIGGQARSVPGLTVRSRPTPLAIADRAGELHRVIEYQLRLPLESDGFAPLAAAEQLARDLTWTPAAVDASEVLYRTPWDSIQAQRPHVGKWPGADQIEVESFRPAQDDRIFVVGGCGDLPREAVVELLRPIHLMAVGARIGRAAAAAAKTLPKPEAVRMASRTLQDARPGQVREISPSVNPRLPARTVPAPAHSLPVLGEYDVVVVGGGTGGAPAGIGAGRWGAKTLVIEYLHALGGVGTAGLISSYYHGNRVGFTREIDRGVAAWEPPDPRTSGGGWNPELKSEWYRRQLRQAGVDIWYGVLGAGAVVDQGQVRGVVVATPDGRGVVWARVVVDATGNADIAAAAGATCRYTDASDVAVQGAGLPPRELGARYTNTDYTFVDDTDIVDVWRLFVTARQKFKRAYDLGQLVATRERRQIVGDLTLSPMDMVLGRTHPDTVVIARSNFDTHGFIVHPMFMLRPPHREDIDVRVPYRCLLPRGLEGILVTGLGISAHRDAVPVIRMQPDVQNQGYAAGVAAAMIAQRRAGTRTLDVKALQRHLVEIGNLPASVLTEVDPFPLPAAKIAEAVARLAHDYEGLETVLVEPETAKPLLRERLAQATSEASRLIYAHVLGMLGDSAGAETLVAAVATAEWDKGWRYTGMGQFGPCMSPLDSFVIALGRSGDPRALAPILDKTRALNERSQFSHFRAVAMALEALGQAAAAPVLAELLAKPGLTGHAVTDLPTALQRNPGSGTDTTTRNQALSELVLARALYRCGDHQGLGERILREYARDLHGLFSRHAQAVLGEPRSRPPTHPVSAVKH